GGGQENRSGIMSFGELARILPADAQIQGEPGIELEGVLDVSAVVPLLLFGDGDLLSKAGGRIAEQVGSHGVTGASGRLRVLRGETGSEGELAGGVVGLTIVPLDAARFGTELQSVAADDLRDVLAERFVVAGIADGDIVKRLHAGDLRSGELREDNLI